MKFLGWVVCAPRMNRLDIGSDLNQFPDPVPDPGIFN